MTSWQQARGRTAALCGAWIVCSVALVLTIPLGRPVNDDYWAIGSLMHDGFGSSLSWYYTEFQGNVVSWFFILLHEVPWLSGVPAWGSGLSIAATFALLALSCWGFLCFVGVKWPTGWRFVAWLTIATTVAWLSLASLISPNAMTFVYYMPSTIVHVWPWCCALVALGLTFSTRSLPLGWLWIALLGFLAGALGLVEAVAIAVATAILGIAAWRDRRLLAVSPRRCWAWLIGLTLGIGVQLVSPATWQRGSGIGSDEALSTNVAAVERLLSQGDALVGFTFSDGLLSYVSVEDLGRILVPVAVAGDLLLRPGLFLVLLLMGWLALRMPEALTLTRAELRARIIVLATVVVLGGIAYSISGAVYAYAGRHVAGLALVVTALVAGLGIYFAPWWGRHARLLSAGVVTATLVLALLMIQQLNYGFQRAHAWDEALIANRAFIENGQESLLVDVPIQAGLSRSGLRDHNGSRDYIEWIRSGQ